MKYPRHLLVLLSTMVCSIGGATAGPSVTADKIVIEQLVKSRIVAQSGRHVKMSEIISTDNVMSIRLNYEEYDEDKYQELAASEDISDENNGKSYKNLSKSYHSRKNKSIAEKLGIPCDDLFVSEYTPYLFYNFNESTMNEVYEKALKIESKDIIESIHLFPKELYNVIDEFDAVVPATVVSEEDIEPDSGILIDSRTIPYDNFPIGTTWTGNGVKIGIFDTGIFDVTNPNFVNNYTEIVYDTYTSASETNHPTVVASILSGKYGIASLAGLYYVDANSDTSYTGLERLINKGVDVINMSLGSSSCYVNGEYNINLEGYIDYIYQSTKVPLVAAAGNTLNLEGSGGYVNLPGLCANVITAGSISSTGVPSVFSSYRMKNDVATKPNIVSVGTSRAITGFSGTWDGTSMSTAAVTGAVALLIEKHGTMNMPQVVTLLETTANRAKIITTPQIITMKFLDVDDLNYNGITTEYLSGINTITVTNILDPKTGFHERTGAGALDIAKALSNSNSQLPISATLTVPSTAPFTIKSGIYLYSGNILTTAIAWERSITVISPFWFWETTTYSTNTLANYDLFIYNAYGLVAATSCTSSNTELLKYTASLSGYYTIKVQPRLYYSVVDANCLNFAYSVN